jgi:hypothetical protein
MSLDVVTIDNCGRNARDRLQVCANYVEIAARIVMSDLKRLIGLPP